MIGRVNEVKVVPGSGWGVSASSGQISRVHGKGMPRVKDGDLRYAMACVSREFPNVSVSLDSIVPVPCDPTGKDLVEKLTNADDFFMTSYSRPEIRFEHPNQTRDELHPFDMLERTSTRFPRPVTPRLTS